MNILDLPISPMEILDFGKQFKSISYKNQGFQTKREISDDFNEYVNLNIEK